MTRSITIALIVFLLVQGTKVSGQEFNCIVNVTSQKVEGTDKRVFESLQNAMYEFINNRKWSNYNIKTEEKLEATILLTVNERLGSDEFRGNLNVVLRRPVFNSAYNSVLLNYVDKGFQFRYIEYQPLDYSDGTFTSNLTSVLAYYAYVFLGYYFDSFSPYGGGPFFEKAQEVVTSAQNAPEAGWKAYEGEKNRYWLVSNLLNPAYSGLRDFSYNYHRLGLDQMYEKVDAGRTSITESLTSIQKVYNARPGLFSLQLLFDAKRDEIINIYGDERVPPMEKNAVVNMMKEMDPANGSKYASIAGTK
ncbi:MAG TPA: DUF4835 family protein [Bacteroidales bacterium]|nr:DUF4835 family protein [Bacteroidales bacterium]HPT09613.1 DUF4835 family protein [Bacteroidales bacterium]